MESPEERNRISDIQIIREERVLMVKAAKQLLILLDSDKEMSEKQRALKIKDNILKISQHLANIGGFCDSRSRDLIKRINLQIFGVAMLDPLGYTSLTVTLPYIVGIIVDFNKRPFKIVGFDIKALGGRIKAILER